MALRSAVTYNYQTIPIQPRLKPLCHLFMSKGAQDKEIEKLIESWRKEFPKDKYIVRGHSKVYDAEPGKKEISSALYRQVKEEKRRKITAQELLEQERELAASTRMRGLPLIRDAEILSDLQHFGCPTNCIDFTRDIHIALFFACNENENCCEPGELVFLRHDRIPFTLPQHFKLPDNACAAPCMELVVPSTTDIDKNRSLFQHSIFVRHREGCFNVPDSSAVKIEADKKKPFRSFLSERDVSHLSLFNDTFGVINLVTEPVQDNWLDSIKASTANWIGGSRIGTFSTDWSGDIPHSMIKQGTAAYCSGDYQKAIQNFDKAILGAPSDRGYRLRGSAHFCNGGYEKALDDIGHVSEAAWNDRDYFLMAAAYYGLRNINLSLLAINNAIGFNPYRTLYHHFRIMLRKMRSGKSSAQPANLKYLDRFIEEPAVSRIVSEKIIDTEKTDKG